MIMILGDTFQNIYSNDNIKRLGMVARVLGVKSQNLVANDQNLGVESKER